MNARSVGSFGSFEYWFAMIKVVAIVLFIVFGVALLAGIGGPGDRLLQPDGAWRIPADRAGAACGWPWCS